VGLADPGAAAIEEVDHVLVHRPGLGAGLFVGGELGTGAGAAGGGLDGGEAERGEALVLPGVDGVELGAAGGDVVGGAEEADVEVIVVGEAGLAGDGGEALTQLGGGAGSFGLSEQEAADVLDDEDPLEIVARGLEQRLDEGPGADEVDAHGLIIGRVEQISVIGALSGRIEGDRLAGDRRAVSAEQVEEDVDVAAGLMRAVAGDRAAFAQAELADGREAARVGGFDRGGGAEQGGDELDSAVAAVLPGLEAKARAAEGEGDAAAELAVGGAADRGGGLGAEGEQGLDLAPLFVRLALLWGLLWGLLGRRRLGGLG
jgi:hypothetical protein